MEEIKVGEYIRDCVSGEIGKVVEVNPNYYRKDDGFKIWRASFKKIKHGPNIIDLIEEGDYVNGYKVLDVVEDMKTGELHLEMPMDYTNPELGDCSIYNKDIKDVVTKEQFNQMKYIVGEQE